MIAQSAAPAAAAGAAHGGAGSAGTAVSAAPDETAPAAGETLLALLAGSAVPFPQAFAALSKGALASAPDGATGKRAAAVADGSDSTVRTAATDAAVPLPDPALAALASVLQWLQQQGVAAVSEPPPAASGASGPVSGIAAEGRGGGPASGLLPAGSTLELTAAITTPPSGGAAGDAGAGQQGGAPANPQQANATPPVAVTVDGSLATALSAALTTPVAQGGQHPATRNAAAAAAVAAASAGAAAGTDLATAMRSLNGATAAIAGIAERSVSVALHDPQWPHAIAAQLLMMGEQKIQAATLRLSPEHLGPVEVHIDLQDSRVNVAFTAAHTETRAALEQSIPQLREVFAGAGLTLGQATVQQQARRESQNSGGAARIEPVAADKPADPVTVTQLAGLIDEYV